MNFQEELTELMYKHNLNEFAVRTVMAFMVGENMFPNHPPIISENGKYCMSGQHDVNSPRHESVCLRRDAV